MRLTMTQRRSRPSSSDRATQIASSPGWKIQRRAIDVLRPSRAFSRRRRRRASFSHAFRADRSAGTSWRSADASPNVAASHAAILA